MGRLIWFSKILCLSFILLQFRVQCSSPSQYSPHSPPHLCCLEEPSALLDFKSATNDGLETWNKSIDRCLCEGIKCDKTKGHVIGLDLSHNYFGYPNISFGFHGWKSLTYLNLSNSEYMNDSLLFEISLLPKLVSLDLFWNFSFLLDHMNFRIPVHNLTEFRFLILDVVNMSRFLPSSLLNLTSSLDHLSLSDCSLQGNFPSQVFQLLSLQLIDLSYNQDLSGNLPESNWNIPLKYLHIRYTSFLGDLLHSIGNLKLLNELSLGGCQFYGSIPKFLANLTEITYLDFSSNLLQGQILDVIGKMHKLTHLSFAANNFGGEILVSIFNLTHFTFLSQSSNKLLGRIPSWLFSLPSLSYLDLHDNRLTRPIDHIEMPNLILQEVCLSNNEMSASIPSSFFDLVNLSIIDLSSNNLSGTITHIMLSKLVDLNDLDLSNNSLLSLSNNGTAVNYSFLNLLSLRFSSCNIHKFSSFLRKTESLLVLDISKNKISGQIHKWEIKGMPLDYLNLSYNFLTGNNITGEIPSSYCNLTSLRVLVLANNSLGGKIPECLGNLSGLTILDLGMNKFHGRIPNSFVNNSSLRTLKLNGNQLEGRLSSSLVNCRELEVLDVGNNRLNDSFPQWLGVLPRLRVLILRSNLFHGAISNSMPAFHFSQLRIIDVSHNDFTGLLPSNYFKNLTAMRVVTGADKAKLEYIGDTSIYYMDSVTVIMKGFEVTLVRIFKSFTTIDFSSNRFHGQIPEELGELNSLVLLNFSHNSLTGQIPSSWGKMTELESLDLSSNKLEGRIPEQLTNLTFLSVLKLSHNELVDQIPQGKQFNTFSNDSYFGNSGLCGFPLTKKCHPEEPTAPPSKFGEEDDSATIFNWKFALAGYGCGLVLGLSLGYIAFTTGKPWRVVNKVEKYQQKFVGRCNARHKKRKIQKPNQRY